MQLILLISPAAPLGTTSTRIWPFANVRFSDGDRLLVESECSKTLEPDIPAGHTDNIFIKSSGSAMAEKMTVRF